jgi:hypothetical protein
MRKIGIGLLLVVVVLTGLGIPLVTYAPPVSDRYLWGAMHVHSSFSDGRASIEEVARAAARSRVDFVMLSDHGAPHRDAALVDDTVDGVRLIGGSEVALPEGNLVVSDVDTLSRFKLPAYPPDAIADVRGWGGIAIIAHPDDPAHRWTYWEHDLLPDGLEVLDVTSQFRESSAFAKLRWAWFSLFSSYYSIRGFLPPTRTLDRWDELLERGPVWGFYAVNAHGGFPLSETGRDVAIPFPSYETVFSYLGLGVERREVYEHDPMRAIRRGEFFMVVRGAGEPEKFVFRAAGDKPPGSFVPPDSALHVEVEAPGLSPRIVLKREGETITETTQAELDFEASNGVYRVEVYLEEHPLLGSGVPWILSNPIFVGMSYPPVAVEELTCSEIEPLALEGLNLEKDDESSGTIEFLEGGRVKLFYRLSLATPEVPDRWVAFALRKPLDLSAYRGLVLEADVSRPMRFWIELRSAERRHHASIKLDKGPNRVTVPWTRFYNAMSGTREPPPALGELDALFLTVNPVNSYTGFRRGLDVTTFGGCR